MHSAVRTPHLHSKNHDTYRPVLFEYCLGCSPHRQTNNSLEDNAGLASWVSFIKSFVVARAQSRVPQFGRWVDQSHTIRAVGGRCVSGSRFAPDTSRRLVAPSRSRLGRVAEACRSFRRSCVLSPLSTGQLLSCSHTVAAQSFADVNAGWESQLQSWRFVSA